MTVPYSIRVSNTTVLFDVLVNCVINTPKCCFSVQQDQRHKMHFASGAGRHAGLTMVLDAKQVEYFAPLQPMTGIWVRHIQTVIPSSVKQFLTLSEEHRMIMYRTGY